MDDDRKDAPPALEERIRIKAYMIWEKEGRPDGRALAHWIMASEMVGSEDRKASESRAGKGKASSQK